MTFKRIAFTTALLITSFASNAEMTMSIDDFGNGVLVAVKQNGERIEGALVTSNIRGQQTSTTDERGRAHFYRGSIPRVYKFEATAPNGETYAMSKFISREK